MLSSTVKQGPTLLRRRIKKSFLKSTGILTSFPFDFPAYLRPSITLLKQALGPTNPKRNTLV